jgi:transposase-like protein
MSLALAVDIALKLKAVLSSEVARSKDARRVLKTMNGSALLDQAVQRDTFNQRSTELSNQLAAAIAEVARSNGQTDITLEQIRARAPFEGEQLAGVFAEIRALSRSLAELDAFNQQLAQKALAFVRAYVNHVAPRPSAYTRRGVPAALEGGTHSERI